MSSVAVAYFYSFLVHVAIVRLIVIKSFNRANNRDFNRAAALISTTNGEHTSP